MKANLIRSIAVFLAALIGIGGAGCSDDSPQGTADTTIAGQPRRLIDFGHMRNGILYHGTLSDLDGTPKATWTYEKVGRLTTEEVPLTPSSFDTLWDGIQDYSVFSQSVATDPSATIDPNTHFVIGAVSIDADSQTQTLFLVPASSTDPDFRRWLNILGMPGSDE